ncbi:MAG: type II toxin-antitoxin system mRNA interferase toxin, RelE/StbE family, partial [Gammaproteobacteria bacterium]|nr:type II toxin-antitoxin system mRNA interferase toxin, RelE/StbE family [Gammaproteobacteria bacterium]
VQAVQERCQTRAETWQGYDQPKTLTGFPVWKPACQQPAEIVPWRKLGRECRDARIEPEWLLLYRVVDDELRLTRTGSHVDLFNDQGEMSIKSMYGF